MARAARAAIFCKLPVLERFKKNCSHPVELGIKPGLLTFDFVSAQSQGFQTCSFAKASPKVKIPGSEWLKFFLNRSNLCTACTHYIPNVHSVFAKCALYVN